MNAVLLSGASVIRKPGFTAVYQLTEAKLALTPITESNVIVRKAVGSGRGIVRMAIGGAASLAGKSYTYSLKSTGPGRYTIEGKYD